MTVYNLHPDYSVEQLTIGHEQQALFVIDNWLADAHTMVDKAWQGETFNHTPADFYPGLRKTAPLAYRDFVSQFVQQQLLPLVFNPPVTQLENSPCVFSLVSQPIEKLLPIQCIPHFDTPHSQQWAVVHYLCLPECGGIGFFRHKTTGFESVTNERLKRYKRVLEDEAAMHGLPPAEYIQGSTALFELTHQVAARFNRAVIYPSNVLHSGLIKQWKNNDGQLCRLTANSFIRFNIT
jgi:hypothetical protein